GRHLCEINLLEQKWGLLKDLLQAFEDDTKYLDEKAAFDDDDDE
ncbi:260_t:CDS:2, partial [Gigaspora rosea]